MRCCVPNCKNDSRHLSKSEGITFHVFPLEQSLREAWLRAVDKPAWEPRERSAVCSEHFRPEDLYETKSGLRRVRTGAVPTGVTGQNPALSTDFNDAALVEVCWICLETSVKLYPIRERKLDLLYEQLTGLSLTAVPASAHLCALCARRLASHARLRESARAAHRALSDILAQDECITLRSVEAAKCNAELLPPFTIHHNHQHFDLDIVYDGIESDKPPLHEVNIEIQIKNEQAKYFEELDSENPLPLKEEENQENIDNIDVDLDNDQDADFMASDHASDSSCDIPIKQLKRDKQKKKKLTKKVKEKVPKVKKKQAKKDPSEPKIDRRRKPFLNEDLNETLFTITNLTIEEQLAEIDKRQESSNYKNAVYKCTACYKGFLEEEAYDSHVLRHTNQCGEFECNICKTHFKHPHALRKHNTAHHTQRFSCNRCPYITTHRQTARLHERWHKGTKYQCPHCQDEFIKFTTYMGHIRIKHPSDWVCQLCGYSFVSQKGIELHKKLKHRLDTRQVLEDGPNCEACNLRFVSDEALRRHRLVSARHTNSEQKPKLSNKSKTPRKRETAPKERKEPSDKNSGDDRRVYPSQMRRAEGPIPCEQCGIQLEDSRAYHGHFRRMHPDKNRTNYPSMKSPCMCEVCGRMFQSYALLKDHTWTHTGEKPFKCELCSKSFRMKQRLVAHRRVHSQQRATYSCAVCGKHFSTHSNRQRHMFIHTGLKPFKCEMCGKCFKHASEKRAHITYVHLKKPWPKRARHKRLRESYEDGGGAERTLEAPVWQCDPKATECEPVYYNLKM